MKQTTAPKTSLTNVTALINGLEAADNELFNESNFVIRVHDIIANLRSSTVFHIYEYDAQFVCLCLPGYFYHSSAYQKLPSDQLYDYSFV